MLTTAVLHVKVNGIMVRVRVIFSAWLVSGYAHLCILYFPLALYRTRKMREKQYIWQALNGKVNVTQMQQCPMQVFCAAR